MPGLSRRQKRIFKSGQITEMSELFATLGDEARCKMIFEMLNIHKAQRRVDKSRDVIAQLEEEHRLPKGFFKMMAREIIGDELPDSQLVLQLATMTARQLLASDETALSAACDWLQSNRAAFMLGSFIDMNGQRPMEILIEKKPEVVCLLLHTGKGAVFESTLDLLTQVANSNPSDNVKEIISDILENCVHSERWTAIAENILPIARIVNPINQNSGMIRIDTSYMTNWCLQEQFFSNPTSMNIQDLIGELCRQAGCPPALKCLDELMDLNRTVDLLMFLDQGIKRYRGHDIHQLNVAALGLFLLETHVENGSSTLKDYIAEVHEDEFPSSTDVKKTWLLSSLLHDHAIPISHMFEIAPVICGIREKEGCDEDYKTALGQLDKTLRLTYKSLFSKRLWRIYHNFFESNSDDKEKILEELIFKETSRIGLWDVAQNRFDQLDHGVLGSVNITGRFKLPLEKNVENSAKAIAVHNLKEVKISFKKDPLAFLLILCDELQEWGREVAIFPKILIDVSSMVMEGLRTEGGKRFFSNALHVSFRCLKNTEHTKFKKPIFDEQKRDFFDKRLDFDDPKAFPKIIPRE